MARQPSQPATNPSGRWTWQFVVAVGLLLAFAALVVTMLFIADGDDKIWQRRVYLFGAVEAIVFTAVGWLFGREVHRSESESARKDATEAKLDADNARDDAKQKADEAARAEREATEERTKGKAVRAAVHNIVPANRVDADASPQDIALGSAKQGRPDPVANLRALVDELYE